MTSLSNSSPSASSPPLLPIGQSRRASLFEAFLNILVGFLISSIANWLFLPLWGFQASIASSLQIGLLFTCISLVRSYALRRCFNHFHITRRRT